LAFPGDAVSAMKLIGPDVGWVVAYGSFGDHLYWTTTGGAQWNEITPTPAARPLPHIAAVFFLDSKTGWALLATGDGDQPQFKLASTTDGGASWTTNDVTIPGINPANPPDAANISFTDSLHGWINFEGGTVAFGFGALLQTSDGGRSWGEVPHDPGVPGSIVLVTPSRRRSPTRPGSLSRRQTLTMPRRWSRNSVPAPE